MTSPAGAKAAAAAAVDAAANLNVAVADVGMTASINKQQTTASIDDGVETDTATSTTNVSISNTGTGARTNNTGQDLNRGSASVYEPPHSNTSSNPTAEEDRRYAMAEAENEQRKQRLLAMEQEATGTTKGKGRQGSMKFPEKLRYMLTYATEKAPTRPGGHYGIAWAKGGTAIAIIDAQFFTESVLPLFFKRTQYPSFIRKMQRWGFKRSPNSNAISKPGENDLFENPHFNQHNTETQNLMRPSYGESYPSKKASNASMNFRKRKAGTDDVDSIVAAAYGQYGATSMAANPGLYAYHGGYNSYLGPHHLRMAHVPPPVRDMHRAHSAHGSSPAHVNNNVAFSGSGSPGEHVLSAPPGHSSFVNEEALKDAKRSIAAKELLLEEQLLQRYISHRNATNTTAISPAALRYYPSQDVNFQRIRGPFGLTNPQLSDTTTSTYQADMDMLLHMERVAAYPRQDLLNVSRPSGTLQLLHMPSQSSQTTDHNISKTEDNVSKF